MQPIGYLFCSVSKTVQGVICVRSVVLSLLLQRKHFYLEKIIMEKKQEALILLKNRSEELQRLPKRSDFSGGEVCFIKQMLGPWPRALEAAGLKEPPLISPREKSRLKREKRRKQQKLQKRSSARDNAETDDPENHP